MPFKRSAHTPQRVVVLEYPNPVVWEWLCLCVGRSNSLLLRLTPPSLFTRKQQALVILNTPYERCLTSSFKEWKLLLCSFFPLSSPKRGPGPVVHCLLSGCAFPPFSQLPRGFVCACCSPGRASQISQTPHNCQMQKVAHKSSRTFERRKRSIGRCFCAGSWSYLLIHPPFFFFLDKVSTIFNQ